MATATIYLYEDPTQNYSISCWADRKFSRGTAVVRKTVDSSNPQTAATVVSAGSITPGSLTSMPSSNLQNLVFSYATVSNYKINISAATLYVTLASDTNFDSINVGDSSYSNPVYNTEYSGSVDLSSINTTDKTITATLRIDPQMSTSVLQALGGGYSWSVQQEATPRSDTYYYSDEIGDVYYYYYYRYYFSDTGIQRSWCSAKVTNVYLVITYEEDTSVIVDHSSATAMLSVGVSGVAKKINDMFIGVNGVAKKVSEAWIGVNGKAKKIFPTFILGMLSPGDVVKIDEMGDGNLVEWIVMHQNYYGEDQTVLMRKYLLDVGTQRLNYEGGSGSSYSNPYFNKTIDNYLSNTWLSSTEYYTFQQMALETTISVKYWSGGTVQSEVRKVWLPSAVNISPSSFSSTQDDDPVGGFDYFITNDNNTARKAYLASDLTAAKYWWTRSTTGGTHPYCRAVGDNGSLRNDSYYSGRYLRPVINVSANNFIKIDTDGSYILLYNG